MNGVGTPGAMFIGDLLKANDSLTYLDVTFNRIYDKGAEHIAQGLAKNEALHHLIVRTYHMYMYIHAQYMYVSVHSYAHTSS